MHSGIIAREVEYRCMLSTGFVRYYRLPLLLAWSSVGCAVKNITDTEVQCSCNHLTNFGIMAVSVLVQSLIDTCVYGCHKIMQVAVP